MSASTETSLPPPDETHRHRAFTLALVGNPNAGKTTLFDRLTGLRAKTANFPGTTVERKVGRLHLDHRQIVVVDLPGLYSLDSPRRRKNSRAMRCTDGSPNTPRRMPRWSSWTRRISNGIYSSSSQFLELKCPVVVALNMMDRRDGTVSALTWRSCGTNSAAPSCPFPRATAKALTN